MHTRPLDATALGLRGSGSLELAGDLPPPPRLAIVGARAAHRRFLAEIPGIVTTAAAKGFSVVSGGALGVDSAVHRAALAAAIPQLAILPAAAHAPYPPGNAGLFAAIAATPGSGVAFVLSPGQQPSPGLFASRNSYVVGLAAAVLVVEAGLRSGSLGTGRLTLRQKRPLAALIGSPGCGILIGAGARALPAEGRGAIAAALGAWLVDPEAPPTEDPWPPALAALGAALRAAGDAGLTIDALVESGALASPGAALVALAEAQARDLVVEIAGGRYRRRDHR